MLLSKTKLEEESAVEDKPEAKLSNSKRNSFGIRVNNEPIEDIFSRLPADVYSRRHRKPTQSTVPKVSLEIRSSSQDAKSQKQESPTQLDEPKPAIQYKKWQRSGLKELPQNPGLTIAIVEQHMRQVLEAPDETKARLHLQLTNEGLQASLKAWLESDHTIDEADKEAILGTGVAFLNKLVADSINEDIRLHKAKEDASLKRLNPNTVYERNRKKVIEEVKVIVEGIEDSVAEAQRMLFTEVWPEFDSKLEKTMGNIRVIQDTKELDAEIKSITSKHNHAIESEFEPVIRGAFRNDEKQMELFKKLSVADQMLVEAEERISRDLKNTILKTIKSDSIELVSNFLSLN